MSTFILTTYTFKTIVGQYDVTSFFNFISYVVGVRVVIILFYFIF